MAKQKSTISRRAALSAGLAATATIAAGATAGALTPDPIYGLIEEHRRLYVAYGDAISARDDQFDVHDHPENPKWCALEQSCDAAGAATWAAECDLVMIGATTPEGWAALLRYEDEHRRAGSEFIDLPTGEKWRMGLMRRMAAFLDGKPEWAPVKQGAWPPY